jgi:TRL-like protein family
MFRRITQIVSLCLAVLLFGGCAGWVDSPAKGIVLTWVNGPINATPYGQTARRGESCAFSILGLVAWGDASINGAKSSGQIKEVASVDHESFNLLGVFGSYCTVVRGS